MNKSINMSDEFKKSFAVFDTLYGQLILCIHVGLFCGVTITGILSREFHVEYPKSDAATVWYLMGITTVLCLRELFPAFIYIITDNIRAYRDNPLPIAKTNPPQYDLTQYHYTPKYRDRKGYVYVLTALHDDTVYKIGRTNNPSDRLRTFNVKLPFDVEYLHIIKTSDMHTLEAQLHRKFGSKRVNGEWFKLDSNDLDYIAELSMGGV